MKLCDMVEKLGLLLLTKDINYNQMNITSKDINRPGIQLTGYLEYYEPNRVQVLGYVEVMYLSKLDLSIRKNIYNGLMEQGAPCFIFCRGLIPDDLFLAIATEKGIPVFSTREDTSAFMSTLIGWLHQNLGSVITIHGCLIDIYGTGVFIQGESGIGKSEVTLELIKRGHRLIADDAVEIHKANDVTLYGKATAIIKDFIELRGIGVVDVKKLYGVQSVLESQKIDLVITLEEYKQDKKYERLALEESYKEILGTKLINYIIPLRPGRNLAIILESAAINYRQTEMGFNATMDFLEKAKLVLISTNNL